MLTEYVQGNSFIHRLHPLTKILWTLVVLFLSFLTSNPVFILVLLGLNVVIAFLSGLLSKMLPVFKGLIFFSLILILCQIFFVEEGKTIVYLFPFAKMGRITDQGLLLSLVMSLRMITTVSTIPILMMTTRMTDLASMLTGNLKLPYSYVFMFLTALQFIPAYFSEMQRILKAQMARGYESDTKNLIRKIRIIIPLAVPLLVMAVRRVQTRAVSMEIRGFGRKGRSNFRIIKPQKPDYVVTLLMLVTVGIVSVLTVI
ncbi:MAG: energy-coupling factor transporter transmembrane protein EcfT [Peptococcaceae bacterium]|nr:energy-coupling factor transporter transmembrane protein EcfT [Peptococcaceae bacterium]